MGERPTYRLLRTIGWTILGYVCVAVAYQVIHWWNPLLSEDDGLLLAFMATIVFAAWIIAR